MVYNGSGQYLRVARGRSEVVEHGCYYLDVQAPDEALYLITLLNADALQPAYAAARETDRHFDTRFWRKVPLPRFDANS